MRTIIFLLAAVLVICGACRKADEAPRVGAKIQLYAEGSDTPTKEIPLPNADEVGQLGQLAGNFTGRFVLVINSDLRDGAISQTVEGHLKEGKIEGTVQTFAWVDGKRRRIAEVGYRADQQHGLSESYYPTTGAIQLRANYESGKKDGEFLMFYPNGKMALRMHYTSGEMEGRCQAFDNSGEEIASGVFSRNKRKQGQFLANLDEFIAGCVAGQRFKAGIVSVDANGKVVENGERMINERAKPAGH